MTHLKNALEGKMEKAGIALIGALIALLGVFLKKVHDYNLWKEFWISILIFISTNILVYLISLNTVKEVFVWGLAITFIAFCIYWVIQFRNKNSTCNTSSWCNENYWRTLDSYAFEKEVANLLKCAGYKTNVTQRSKDDGVDVIAENNGIRIAVQCKRYNGHKVGVKEVRELWGAKDDFNASNAIMVALDGLTREAEDYVQRRQPYYEVMTIDEIISLARRIISTTIN